MDFVSIVKLEKDKKIVPAECREKGTSLRVKNTVYRFYVEYVISGIKDNSGNKLLLRGAR